MSPIETTPAPVAAPGISTGPTSHEGKAVSSRNAVKHNLCSKKLTGSDLDELKAIRTRLEAEWEPQTETEHILLGQMALSHWRMDRALSLELAAFEDESIDSMALGLALRYRTSAERAFYKALAELQRVQALIARNAKSDHEEQTEEEADESEEAVQREIERLIMAPFAPAPQFVSQNGPAAPPQGAGTEPLSGPGQPVERTQLLSASSNQPQRAES
jgi:hypothetical protein